MSKPDLRREIFSILIDCLSNCTSLDFQTVSLKSIREYLENLQSENGRKLQKIYEEKLNNRMKRGKGLDFKTSYKGGKVIGWKHEFGTEESAQFIRIALAIRAYALKDRRVRQFFEMFVVKGLLNCSAISGSSYIMNKLSVRKRNVLDHYQTGIAGSFEMLIFFHACFYRVYVAKKSLSRKDGNRIGFTTQIMCKAWNHAAKNVGYKKCEDLLLPYILFNHSTHQFEVISSRSNGFSPIEQRYDMSRNFETTVVQEKIDEKAWNRSDEEDRAIRVVVKLFFENLKKAVQDESVFTNNAQTEWETKELYVLKDSKLPPIFCTLPKEVTRTLGWEEDIIDVDVISISEPEHSLPPDRDGDVSMTEPYHLQQPITEITPNSESSGKRKRGEPQIKEEPEIISESQVGPQPKSRQQNEDVLSASELAGIIKILLEEMDKTNFCSLYNASFANFYNEMALLGKRELLERNVQLILCDPPYNTRRIRSLPNSSHDLLTRNDIDEAVIAFDHFLSPSGHGVVFCSAYQFKTWFDKLSTYENEEDKHGNESDGSSPVRKKTMAKVFHVESKPLHFIREKGFYTSFPGRRGPSHTSVVEQAVHFWRKDADVPASHSHLPIYEDFGEFPCSYPIWTNCNDGIKLDKKERIFITPGSKKMLRPEQKPIALLRHLIRQFTVPGDIVMDLFSGTFSTARACISVSEQRRFIGCEIDESCYNIALQYVLSDFWERALKGSPKLSSNLLERIRPNAERLRKHVAIRQNLQAEHDITNVPDNLPLYQRLPRHVLSFVASMKGQNILKYWAEPYDKWPSHVQNYLNSTSIDALLANESAFYNLLLAKSKIKHVQSGSGVFAGKRFVKGEILCHFYGTLVYRDLNKEGEPDVQYGSGVMATNKDNFGRYSMKARTVLKISGKRTKHDVFIVPAKFCIAGFINDYRYNKGDEEYKDRKSATRRRPNVEITCEEETIPSIVGYYSFFKVKAIQDIAFGDELYLDYGEKYQFPK